MSLIALLAGCLEYRVFTVKKIKRGFISGIIAIVSIILFYIFIQFGLISNNTAIANYYSYSTGFYMMIFASILFFSAYIIKSKTDSVEQIPDSENNLNPIQVCSKCGYNNPENSKFCEECGNKL